MTAPEVTPTTTKNDAVEIDEDAETPPITGNGVDRRKIREKTDIIITTTIIIGKIVGVINCLWISRLSDGTIGSWRLPDMTLISVTEIVRFRWPII